MTFDELMADYVPYDHGNVQEETFKVWYVMVDLAMTYIDLGYDDDAKDAGWEKIDCLIERLQELYKEGSHQEECLDALQTIDTLFRRYRVDSELPAA